MFVIILQTRKLFPFLKSGRKVTGYIVTFRLFVSNATKLEGTGVRIPLGVREFLFSPTRPDRLCGPPNLIFSWYPGYFSGVKRTGLDVNHSSPSSAGFKNEWSHTFTLPLYFIA